MTSRRKRKNWLKHIMVIILVIVLAMGGFMIWKSFQTEAPEVIEMPVVAKPVVTTKPESEQPEEEKVVEEPEEKVEIVKEKVEQFDGGDPNKEESLTGVITYAGVSGGDLIVRVNIDQYLAGGTCKLKLLGSGGASYEETVDIADSAATATCKGFNVATTKIPNGKVSVSILVTSGAKTGTIEGEVNL